MTISVEMNGFAKSHVKWIYPEITCGDWSVAEMERNLLRQMIGADVDRLTEFLTQRQFVEPHRPIEGVLQQAVERFGFSPSTVQDSLGWLQLDKNLSIGRLRRTELVQLGRTLRRQSRQNVIPAARELQPN